MMRNQYLSYTFYYMVKDNKTISNEKFINMLVSSGNAKILSQYKTTNLVNSTMKFFLNIDLLLVINFYILILL